MSVGYRVAYALHVTPWDTAGEAGADQLARLVAQAVPVVPGAAPGAALDVGCGTGAHAVELARRGWSVTGVDTVPRAVREARRRAERAGVEVTVVRSDATTLAGVQAPGGFRLVLDVGCFHGLSDAGRAAAGAAVTRVASPDAALLVMAMAPGRRGPGPRGASGEDLARAFPGWRTDHDEPADTSGMPRVLRGSAPRFWLLRRV